MNILYFPGAFRPPHFGHFNTLTFYTQQLNIEKAIIVISKLDRGDISQDMSCKIWEIYAKYLSINTEINKSIIHNLDTIEESIYHQHLSDNNTIITKIENITRYNNRFKYNKHIDIKLIKNSINFRASSIRKNLHNSNYILDKLPNILSDEDKQKVIFILNERVI